MNGGVRSYNCIDLKNHLNEWRHISNRGVRGLIAPGALPVCLNAVVKSIMTTEELISVTLENNGMALREGGAAMLVRLSELLLAANEHVNLTSIDTTEGVALLHFADSLTVLPYVKPGEVLLDVGSGAGFPALPLAIAEPGLRVTALDATQKKVTFAADAALGLGLRNFAALCGRAETLGEGPPYRERYDVAVARAVAKLNVLCELCMPFIRVGGRFIAMKSRSATEEISQARHALTETGGEISENIALTLRGEGEELSRSIIIIQKVAPTPKIYPRRFAQINKNPL